MLILCSALRFSPSGNPFKASMEAIKRTVGDARFAKCIDILFKSLFISLFPFFSLPRYTVDKAIGRKQNDVSLLLPDLIGIERYSSIIL